MIRSSGKAEAVERKAISGLDRLRPVFSKNFTIRAGAAASVCSATGTSNIRRAAAFFQIARRGRRVRGVAAGNDEGRDVEAQQILGLGAGRGIAVEQFFAMPVTMSLYWSRSCFA